MKRSLSILLIFCIIASMAFCLLGCEDENQRRLNTLHEGAEQAARRAEESRREYEQLQKDLAEYERIKSALDNAKKP